MKHFLEGVDGTQLFEVGRERKLNRKGTAACHEDLDGIAWGETTEYIYIVPSRRDCSLR